MSGERVAAQVLNMKERPRAALFVTGGIGAGKSTACLEGARMLRASGLTVGGIVALRWMERGETAGYDILDLQTQERRVMARVSPPGESVGRYFMRPEGFAFARDALAEAARHARVVFVDEIGPWELRGGGLAAPLRELVPQPLLLVLVVRAGLIEAVRSGFGVSDDLVLDVGRGPSRASGEPAGMA